MSESTLFEYYIPGVDGLDTARLVGDVATMPANDDGGLDSTMPHFV